MNSFPCLQETSQYSRIFLFCSEKCRRKSFYQLGYLICDKKNIIVAYNNPHPDLAALQSALENFNDYSVKICPTEGLKLEDLINFPYFAKSRCKICPYWSVVIGKNSRPVSWYFCLITCDCNTAVTSLLILFLLF